jgi:hypothetical protein
MDESESDEGNSIDERNPDNPFGIVESQLWVSNFTNHQYERLLSVIKMRMDKNNHNKRTLKLIRDIKNIDADQFIRELYRKHKKSLFEERSNHLYLMIAELEEFKSVIEVLCLSNESEDRHYNDASSSINDLQCSLYYISYQYLENEVCVGISSNGPARADSQIYPYISIDDETLSDDYPVDQLSSRLGFRFLSSFVINGFLQLLFRLSFKEVLSDLVFNKIDWRVFAE